MPPFDAQIVKVQAQLYKVVPVSDRCLSFWIVVDAFVKPTDENPWLATTSVHQLGDNRFLLEMDGDHVNGWDYTGPAFETSGSILAAMCAGPTGVVKFKDA